MTDAQAALAKMREALAAGPTPGPWYVRTNRHPTTDGRSWGWLDAAPPGGPQRAIAGVRVEWEGGDTSAVNARYLAACSPANIAVILAHVDAQAAEIERLRSERDSIAIENSKFMDQIERLRDELRRQLAEAELDARRYRDWLRGGANIPPESTRWARWEVRYWDGRHWNTLFAEALDTSIDAAMGGSNA